MEVCNICGKKLKNTQGLRGHLFFSHQELGQNNEQHTAQRVAEPLLSDNSATQLTTEQKLSKLEHRLEVLEDNTGVKEPSELEKVYGIPGKPLTEQVAQLAQQLKVLESSTINHAELAPVLNRLDELTQQLTSLNLMLDSIQDAVKSLEMGLSKKADKEELVKQIDIFTQQFGDMMSQFDNQLSQQKWVTDWVRKKFTLLQVKC